MKWRLCAAVAALSLLLSGCSSLLARSYTSVTPHSATPPAEGDSSILRVENYQELVNALIYLISLGEEEGTVRMYNYDQDVEQSLSNACLEVVQEDPLGAYSVDFIRYDVTPIVSYYEAAVEITYRRTREQVSAIVAATGATAIRSQLKDLLSSFGTEAALRISYFEGDETYIQTLFREAYYASPDTALDLPEAQVYIYPQGEESGRQRIVEVLLTYHLEQKELQRRRTALARRANEIVVSIWGTEGDEAIQTVSAAVLDAGHYDPEGGASAYDALVAGAADSEGLSLAALLLAQRLELTGMVVPGTLDGSPHFWNVVRTESGYRHLDLTRGADSRGQYPLLSDREMAALGYQWDTQAVPPCGEPSDSQEGTEDVPGTSSASSDGAE